MTALIVRLDAIWNRHRRLPLIWGQSDCATFLNECYQEKSGSPLLSADLINYNSELGAMRMLALAGVQDVEEFLQRNLAPITPERACIGDLLYFGRGNRLSFPAVVFGELCVSKSEQGPVSLRRSLATHGYRVPCHL